MKTITNIIHPLFALFAFACFALLSRVQAVTPAPDGGYPNGNTAEGNNALFSLTTGSFNTAVGSNALRRNITGNNNTAVGYQALDNDFQQYPETNWGSSNTAVGSLALHRNTVSSSNTAVGASALLNNAVGFYNTALGTNAGSSVTGNGNVCIGAGVSGVAGESDTTRIRNIFSSVASAKAVYVNSDNKIGTLPSSARFKEEIKPMNKASEVILALKPVSFRYKPEIDRAHAAMFGLIAEEVEKVDPDLVTRNDKGEAETVRYEAVNAMLLNEFLKEHRRVEELEKQVEALSAGLQKVNDKLELSKPAPLSVLNNR